MEFEKNSLVEEVRKRINQDTSKYSSKDIFRVNNEDWWIEAFLSTNNSDLDVTTAIFKECLRWRSTFGVEIWLNLANHNAKDKDVEKLLVYWLERHMTETLNGKILLLIDMTNVGNQNMDFDFIKFLLRCFKYYYPNTLSAIIFYETPAKFSAQLKVIRSYMDETFLSKTENANRESIVDIIPNKYLPIRMGGNSVKFEEDEDVQRNGPLQLTSKNGHNRSNSQTRKSGQIPENLRPIIEAKLNSDSENWLQAGFLSVCPKQDIYLNKVNGENDPVDIVILKNNSTQNVLFKIKTTSPEKFRVRPSMGVVKPGGIEAVRLYLQNEYKNSSRMERFLIMALNTESASIEDFGSLWKSAQDIHKFERKLNCLLGDMLNDGHRRHSSRSPDNFYGGSNDNETQLINQVRQLAQQQNVIIALLFFVLLVQFATVLYIRNAIQPDKNVTTREDL